MRIQIVFFILLYLSLLPTSFAQTPELVVPVGHRSSVGIYAVDISPDGKLAVSLVDKEIKIWDFQSGTLLKTFQHPQKAGYSRSVFSPDGGHIYASAQGRLSIINTATLMLERDITGHLGAWQLIISPDGNWAYCGDFFSSEVQKVNLATGEITQLFNWASGKKVASLSLSPEGAKLLAMVGLGPSGSGPYQSILISASTGEQLKVFPANEQYQCITPTGNLFKVGWRDGATEEDRIYRLTWVEPNSMRVVGEQEISWHGKYPMYPESAVKTYQFFPHSDRVFYPIETKAFVAAPKDAAQQIDFKNRSLNYKRLKFTNDGRQLLVGSTKSELVQFDLAQKTAVREFGRNVFSPRYVNAAAAGQAFTVSGRDGAKPWLFSWAEGHSWVQRLSDANSNLQTASRETTVNVSPDGSLVAWGNGRNEIKVASTRQPGTIKQTFTVPNAYQVVISADNKYVVVSSQGTQISLCDIATGAVKPLATGSFHAGLTDATGRYFFGLGRTQKDSKLPIYTDDTYTIFIDLQTGKKLWENTDTVNRSGADPFFLNEQEVGYRTYQDYVVLNRQTGALRKQSLSVKYANLVQNGAYAVSEGLVDENIVKIYRTRDDQKLADIILAAEGSDWAILTPDGRFDASPGMLKQLYYTKGREIIPLEALSEKYYTPNLLAQLFVEQPNPEPKKDDIKNLKLPPIVKILPPQDIDARNLLVAEDTPALRQYDSKTGKIKLTVEATANDDGVSEIRLFHNGKAVGTGTRNLTVEDDRLEKKKAQTFEVELSEGANAFRAVALNSQRTESRPDDIVVANKIAKPVTTESNATATLYLLVVGINQYKNTKHNLNYATADATAFKAAMERQSTGIFGKVNAVFVSDAQATKAGIEAELDKIKLAAQPRDVFIFYYAGHGVMNEKKEFYLIPHDVTQLYGADEALAQKGFSAALMQQYSREIKAQKQLFILDACQSAAALEQVAMRGAAEEKAIAQLARATGTHWLTASGSEQFASEFKQLGHGTFTYAILEALSGKADKGNDRRITVKELDAYLQEVVPELTAKYKGMAQYPASYGFGNDFPIGVVK